MVNIEQYIQSGIIEAYCLGSLPTAEATQVTELAQQHPAIQAEIDRTLQTLEDYSASECPTAGSDLRNRVMMSLSQLDKSSTDKFTAAGWPLISMWSEHDEWLQATAHYQPNREFRNLFSYTLRNDNEAELFLIWAKQGISPEDHHNERESFLILEGACQCLLGDEHIYLSAGDFLEIPLDVKHTVEVTSLTPIKAVIQRLKVA